MNPLHLTSTLSGCMVLECRTHECFQLSKFTQSKETDINTNTVITAQYLYEYFVVLANAADVEGAPAVAPRTGATAGAVAFGTGVSSAVGAAMVVLSIATNVHVSGQPKRAMHSQSSGIVTFVSPCIPKEVVIKSNGCFIITCSTSRVINYCW